MKTVKAVGLTLLPASLVLALTGCGSDDLLLGGSKSSTQSSGDTGKAATLTAEQEAAAKACLTVDAQKALQPGTPEIDTTLIDACRKLGQKTYDGLASANKTQEQTAKLADELKTTTSLARATQIVSALSEVKRLNDEGVVITNTQAFAAQVLGLFPNANKEDIEGIGSTGSGAVNPASHKVDTGGAPFYDGKNITYLDSTDAIAKWLASGTPAANTAKDRVASAIKAAGKDDKEVDRALSGAGYIPIQLKGESQIMGSSYFVDGKFHQENRWRQSQAGDMYWLFVTADGILITDATLRADCGNVGAKQIRIVKINIPPAVPVGQPPGKETCPEGTVLQPNGECHTPPPPVKEVCPPDMPYGTWPVCKDGVERAPQNQNNLPVQQMPNVLPARPDHAQPVQPANPGAVYTPPPAAPAAEPAPVTQTDPDGTTVVIPPPSPNPEGPRPTAPAETGAPPKDNPSEECIVAPGKTSC